jgi:heavy metal sensor kinase
LTLWYAAALAVVMLAYGAFVYATLRRSSVAEIDHQLHEDRESVEELLGNASDGSVDWRSELAKRWPEDDGYERRVLVHRPDGDVLFESAAAESMADPWPAPGSSAHIAQLDGAKAHVEFFRSAERMHRELDQLLMVLALGIPVGVGLAALGGYLLARRALAPVGQMADRARSITASNLSQRLPAENPADEFGQLATVFNATLARLDGSFEQLRRFTSDASHELRTPLTAIRTVGEVGLREARTVDRYREIVGSMLEEVDRLTRLVDSLLTLSRADAGRITLHSESFDLAELAREVTSDLSVLAEEKSQRLELAAPGRIVVHADRAILRLAVVNLVDNAIKYAPVATAIHVSVDASDGSARLSVADSGPGIAPEHHAHLFERFYRVDAARGRDAGGAGLGLAIARWAVEAHRGRLELQSRLGAGSTFTAVLPAGDSQGGSS